MLSWLVAGVGDISRKRVLPAILAEPNSVLAGIITREVNTCACGVDDDGG